MIPPSLRGYTYSAVIGWVFVGDQFLISCLLLGCHLLIIWWVVGCLQSVTPMIIHKPSLRGIPARGLTVVSSTTRSVPTPTWRQPVKSVVPPHANLSVGRRRKDRPNCYRLVNSGQSSVKSNKRLRGWLPTGLVSQLRASMKLLVSVRKS